MNKKLLLAVLMVVGLAVPAFASVQNVKVSGFVDSMYLYRDRFDLRGSGGVAGLAPQYEQSLFITWTGLRVDADLTDNVSATIRLLNERPWGSEDKSTDNSNAGLDVNLAFVKLKDIASSNLSATVGRQAVSYGNAFIVNSEGTNNSTSSGNGLSAVAKDLTKRSAFDGVRLVADYNPLVLDLVAFKIHANNLLGGGSGSDKDDDVDLFGLNANYQLGDEWGSVVEAYFFAKIDQSVKTKVGAGVEGAKADTVYTPGIRASATPIKGLNMQAEVALQRGNKALTTSADDNNQQREALGIQTIANYALPFDSTKEWNPVITGVYTYVSGDSNPGDSDDLALPNSNETWTAWDPMFENQAAGRIYNSLFNLTNDHIVELSAQVNPIEDVTTKLTWTGLWLDKNFNTVVGGTEIGTATPSAGTFFLQPDGSSISPKVTTNKSLGQEIDADLTYAYTEDVNVGLSFGWFFPGDVFDPSFHENAKQAMATLDVNF